MKKTILLVAIAIFTFGNANAQFGKLKKKLKSKTSKPVKGSANDPSRKAAFAQKPVSDLWQPEVELITDPSKITPEYLKKMSKIADWVASDKLSNLERRHIYNLIKRLGVIANYARGKSGARAPIGARCDFVIMDTEVIRYEAINRGTQPSVDGNEYHVLGFETNYSVDDETYKTPFHKVLREEIFPAAVAMRDYALNKWGTSFKYIQIHEEYGGNMPICTDKGGKAIKCKFLK
ncbi:MAG: hypothetical protein ACPGTO_00365 [Polaribacter sp.]